MIKKIAAVLKEELKPLRLFLYGSRAAGTNRTDSDYDFVLVVPQFDSKERYRIMSDLSARFFNKFAVQVQVWMYSEAEFEDWKDEFSSIPETALNTGKEIDLG